MKRSKMVQMLASIYTSPVFGSYSLPEATHTAERVLARCKNSKMHPVDYLQDNYGSTGEVGKVYRQAFQEYGLGHGSLLAEIAKHHHEGCGYDAGTTRYLIQERRRRLRSSRPHTAQANPFTFKPWIGKLASVEIEYYGAELPNHPLRKTGTDGSLSSGGVEMRLTSASTPALAEKLKAFIDKASPRWDTKCGLHVHIDCRDCSEEQALAVHNYLWRFKKFLKELTPASRHDNDYCKWTPNVYDRYRAINFASFSKHRTIEWRMQGPMCRRDWRPDARWAWRVAAWVHLCRTMTRQAVALVQSGQDLPETPATREEFEAFIGLELAQWCEHRRVVLSRSEGRASELVQSAIIAA